MEFEFILINGLRLYPIKDYFVVYEYLYNESKKSFVWIPTDEIQEIKDVYRHNKTHENQISSKLWSKAIYD